MDGAGFMKSSSCPSPKLLYMARPIQMAHPGCPARPTRSASPRTTRGWVRVTDLLEQAGRGRVRGCAQVDQRRRSDDRHSAGRPTHVGDAMLAVGMNGGPATYRARVPGAGGRPGPLWLCFRDEVDRRLRGHRFADFSAYWTDRGFAAFSPISSSWIDVPASFANLDPGWNADVSRASPWSAKTRHLASRPRSTVAGGTKHAWPRKTTSTVWVNSGSRREPLSPRCRCCPPRPGGFVPPVTVEATSTFVIPGVWPRRRRLRRSCRGRDSRTIGTSIRLKVLIGASASNPRSVHTPRSRRTG